jgi:dTDP-4-dehydrorhamnose reductase
LIRVLVMGRHGMLGHRVFSVLNACEGIEVEGTARTAQGGALPLDAEAGLEPLREFLCSGQYDYSVNCVGITKSRIDPSLPESTAQAIAVNALFPHWLATAAREGGTRVVHISTDAVFSASQESCVEGDKPNATDVYGRTKVLGEVSDDCFLTIRCSIVGVDPNQRRGLVEWVRGQSAGACLSGYTDHLWNGVTTQQFAEVCRSIIVKDAFTALREEGAVHHFCPNPAVSKYDLVRIISAVFAVDVEVLPTQSPEGPVKRILATEHRGLSEIYGEQSSIEEAMRRLRDED